MLRLPISSRYLLWLVAAMSEAPFPVMEAMSSAARLALDLDIAVATGGTGGLPRSVVGLDVEGSW